MTKSTTEQDSSALSVKQLSPLPKQAPSSSARCRTFEIVGAARGGKRCRRHESKTKNTTQKVGGAENGSKHTTDTQDVHPRARPTSQRPFRTHHSQSDLLSFTHLGQTWDAHLSARHDAAKPRADKYWRQDGDSETRARSCERNITFIN